MQDAVVDVGDVHHVRHAVATDAQVALEQVVEEVAAEVADMRVIPHRGTAGVETYVAGLQGRELFAHPAQGVEQRKGHRVSSSRTTACAAMPSERPSDPTSSGEVAFTPTACRSRPKRSASSVAISARCGCRRGSCATTTESTFTTR